MKHVNNQSINMSQSEKILNSAFKCIATKGYANVSLRDIADEAGVVLSQLNYYYKNKEGLFTEVVKMLSLKYLNEIEDTLKNGKSKSEKISSLIKYFQQMLNKNPELFKIFYDMTSMALWSTYLKDLLNDLFNKLTFLIEKYVINTDHYKEKFKEYSSSALSRMILGTLFGTSVQVILADSEKKDIAESLGVLRAVFS
ncbi:transcriptional regulator, TetR family [Clostridium acidisoli DSM 12555]|uniref:Transcriptional regulator, TetR family n=1 Tax=Clostridium acidisoli DSM 12555 TaxID=1121291 RepID=A0A1W1XDM1_9CLOT|nr:transcriptional regulator, TetR family [Clostridium acidisoli DSM 12555]